MERERTEGQIKARPEGCGVLRKPGEARAGEGSVEGSGTRLLLAKHTTHPPGGLLNRLH